MKKTSLIFAIIATSAGLAQALSYVAGGPSVDPKARDMKWSTNVWYNTALYASKPLPSKPGSGDAVSVAWGPYSLDVDQDVNVQSLGVGEGAKLTAQKRNIRVKKTFGVSISSGGRKTAVKLEDCNLDFGSGISFGFYDKAQNAEGATVDFIDCNLISKGDFVVIIPANDRFTNKVAKGITATFAGRTKAVFGGGTLIDSIIKDNPKEWFMKWVFEEKDGKLPFVSFAKNAQINSLDVEVKLKSALRPGKYPLLELGDKKCSLSLRSITLNGKPYTLGDTAHAGASDVKIEITPSPTGKDVKTSNDLVLEVLK